jgi:hypothetical protein
MYIMILEAIILICIICLSINIYDRWSTTKQYHKCMDIAIDQLDNRIMDSRKEGMYNSSGRTKVYKNISPFNRPVAK